MRWPSAELRLRVLGRSYHSREGERRFAPLIQAADKRGPLLSFANLIEAHVLRSFRTEHGVPIKAVRSSLRYAERELGIDHLLLREELSTSGGELFLEHYGQLINLTVSGQLAMKAVLEAYLRRVEWKKDGLPGRLYPFVRGVVIDEAPRLIAIDPLIAFGRPVLIARAVSTQVIADRIDAGETVERLAEDYDLSSEEIREAILYQRAA